MTLKTKKQKISHSTPLSAVAARRQQQLISAAASNDSTPEAEEHAQVDNQDIDEDEKESLDSAEGSSDSDTSGGSDQDADLKTASKSAAATSQQGRRDRRIFVDPQSVSSFKPSSSNTACIVNPGGLGLILVGMKTGETIVFQGCARIIPLIGYASALGYIMSGTVRKKKAQDSSGTGQDLSTISTFTIFSPRTHALAVVESVNLTKSQKTSMVQQRTAATPAVLKQQLETLLSQFTHNEFDTVLAVQSASECGLFGIEKVVPLFKGIFTMKQASRSRATEDDDRLAQARFETSLAGFHPILDTTEGIAALRIPVSWRDAIQSLISATIDETGAGVKRSPVSVVCGGKKMGKSTFSRLILNRMMNRYRRVAFIECDVGQSEFTPVGMVALHVLESPALGAPFTHPKRPYRAFFVGNSTPRDDPKYYMACITELVKTYYAEVSHTRCWEDAEDYDSQNGDNEDEHVPLIINTQGWIKGLGYELLLQILDYTVPSHIFGFHSPSTGDSNLPSSFLSTLYERATASGRKPPSFFYVSAASVGDENNISPFTKYHPADHRALALLSYFYQKQSDELNSRDNGTLEWDFTQALVVRRPWCWDWSLAKGIWILFDQVPRSQILYALNGSLVALTGDKEDPRHETRQDEDNSSDQNHPTISNPPGSISPPNYLPLGQYPPPPPELTTCHGLAIIRSIQPTTRTLHIITPIPLSTLKKCNGIVKGSLHMPLHANLDHNEESPKVPGVAGVPWKKVPYLHYEASVGQHNPQPPVTGGQSPRLGQTPATRIPGSDAKVTRKNLGRKRLR
ncbi:hypothetical protein B0O80DRAFT_434480 [Mortierella sp. GBAus27b]|nr:hypothetical protein B0O80DRAFT_434480 [Mortierella sp. GBAus27b]